MNDYIKNKWTIAVIWAGVIAILIWIIAGTWDNGKEDELLVNQETYTIESVHETAETSDVNGYYLVKSDSGTVKVFWVDAEGEHLHKETSIPFGLLSGNDQKMLESGVKIYSEEELAGFLENFDS